MLHYTKATFSELISFLFFFLGTYPERSSQPRVPKRFQKYIPVGLQIPHALYCTSINITHNLRTNAKIINVMDSPTEQTTIRNLTLGSLLHYFPLLFPLQTQIHEPNIALNGNPGTAIIHTSSNKGKSCLGFAFHLFPFFFPFPVFFFCQALLFLMLKNHLVLFIHNYF